MKITVSVLDYIGRYEIGVLVSCGLMYEGQFYGGIFFYTDTQMNINVEESLTQKLGHPIEEDPEYLDILRILISKVEPFEKVFSNLPDIKMEDYEQ
jgi:hypothetical protein